MQNQACFLRTVHLCFQLCFPHLFFCGEDVLQGRQIYMKQAENDVGF